MSERTGSFDNKIYLQAIRHEAGDISANGRVYSVMVVEDLRDGEKFMEIALPDGVTDSSKLALHVRDEVRKTLSNPRMTVA